MFRVFFFLKKKYLKGQKILAGSQLISLNPHLVSSSA